MPASRKKYSFHLLLVLSFLFIIAVFSYAPKAFASDFYFHDADSNADFGDTNNWFSDAGFTSPTGTLPTSGDNIFSSESIGTDSSGSASVANATFTGSMSLGIILTVSGNVTFNDTSHNNGGVNSGNATFNNSSYNSASVSGDATFNGTYTGVSWHGTVSGATTLGSGVTITLSGSDVWSIDTSGWTDNGSEWIFNDSSSNSGTVSGTATFNDTSYNSGNIAGNGTSTFNGSSYNYYGGSVTHDATFDGTSYNSGTITHDATFDGTSYNSGTITHDATFNDSSSNQSTVSGSATFNDTSYNNNGTVSGNATFTGTYTGVSWHGTVSGSTILASGATITLSSSDVWTTDTSGWTDNGSEWIFNDSSSNRGTVSGTATFNDTSYNGGTVSGTATFNGTSYSGGTVSGNAIFNGTSHNDGIVSSDATFNDTSYNGGTAYVSGDAIFNGTSSNSSTVSGTATFNDTSYNGGTVSGNATFNNSSYNGGTVSGNATFNNSSYNGGTVSGNATFTGTYTGVSWHGTVSGVTTLASGVTITITSGENSTIDASGWTDNGSTWIFNSTAVNSGTVSGNATFDSGGANEGIVLRDAIFNNNYGAVSYNLGTVSGNATFNASNNYNGGTVSGNATFNGGSLNYSATVSGDATFNDSSYNSGTIAGNGTSTFNGSSFNTGTVSGNATFNDSSNNYGTVSGNATFNGTYTSTSWHGTVTGATTLASGVTVTLSGSDVWTTDTSGWTDNGSSWIFNDSTYIAAGASVSGIAIFNGNSYNNGTVSGTATFNDTSYNSGNIAGNGTSTFNGSSYNYYGGSVTHDATFDGTSYNTGTVSGNAIFNGTSYNSGDGSVSNTATFNDTSYNNGSVFGDATFNSEATENNGRVTGRKTRRYSSDITTTRDFVTTGPWTVLADGVVVDITGATYDSDTMSPTYTTLHAANGGSFIPPLVFDTTPPVISSIVTSTTPTTATISFDTDENATSTIQYGLTTGYGSASSSDVFATSTSYSLSGLIQNTLYHYHILASDASGNVADSGDQTFTTAAASAPVTVPTVSIQAASGITSAGATLNGTIINNNNASSTIRGFNYGLTTSYGSVASSTGTFNTGAFSQAVSGLTANTLYHYQAFAVNTAGTGTSTDQTFTTSAVLDTTPPVISAIATSTTQTTATVSFNTNEAATSTINFGLTAGYGSASSSAVSATSTSYLLSGLSAGTLYHFRISAWDAAGNLATSSDRTFTTTSLPVSAPTVTAQAASSVSTSFATLNGTITNNNNASSTIRGFNYGLTTNYGSVASSTGTFSAGAFSQALSGLSASTTYHYQAFATNTAGTGTSTDQTFTTSAVLDTTPPVISAIATSTTQTTASISFSTNEAATSTVQFGPTASYGSMVNIAPATTTHAASFSGLSADTTYHYKITATDIAGNTSSTIDAVLTTTSLSLAAPTITVQAASSVATSSATLNGTISNNNNASSTIRGFNYGLTTSYGSTASSTGTFDTGAFSQTISGLSPSTTYHYQAFAVNTAGTGTSSDLTFTTSPSLPDTTAPIIATPAIGYTDTSVTISWLTNEAADAQLEYGTSTSYTASTTLDTTLETGHQQTISGLTQSTLYHFRILARDASNNLATSSDYSFTTSATVVSSGGGGSSGGSSGGGHSGGGGGGGSYVASAPNGSSTVIVTIPVPGCLPTYLFSPLTGQKCPATASVPAATSASTGASSGLILPVSFVRNLTLGSVGEDVRALQKFLNFEGFFIQALGPGAPGEETAYFGLLTKKALAKFQVAHHIIPSIGFFGPLTRSFIQSMI